MVWSGLGLARCAALLPGEDGLIEFAPPTWRVDSVKPRPKLKTSDKPATPRKVSNGKVSIARLVPTSEPNIDDEAEERARGGVQSLGRAFSIIEEVARHREGIGLADLSKLVGLHNSTTFHLAKTLVSLGYLRQERDTKRYRVGRPLFALAASALDEIEMVNLATPILEDLSRESGESGHFAVRMGDAVVVIARTSGAGAFQLTDRVGPRALELKVEARRPAMPLERPPVGHYERWLLSRGDATVTIREVEGALMFEVADTAEVHDHSGKWTSDKSISLVRQGKTLDGKLEKDACTATWVSAMKSITMLDVTTC